MIGPSSDNPSEAASIDVVFEARPNPVLFSLWQPRSMLILLLPVALAALFIAYLRVPAFFSTAKNWLVALEILLLVDLCVVVLSAPMAYVLGSRKRVQVTHSAIKIFVVAITGEKRDVRSYLFSEIQCIRVGRCWFNHANISVKRRKTPRSARTLDTLEIRYYDDSFFRLSLLDDLRQGILYGIPNYEELLSAAREQANNLK